MKMTIQNMTKFLEEERRNQRRETLEFAKTKRRKLLTKRDKRIIELKNLNKEIEIVEYAISGLQKSI